MDLGCGTGDIVTKIGWDYDKFVGVDSAPGMCDKHPKSSSVIVLNNNFEDKYFQDQIQQETPFDLVISSSALQWAEDIEKLIQFTSTLSKNIAFAIFTCNTFADIYKLSNLPVFLPNAKDLIEITKKYFDVDYEIKTYRIEFEDNISKFRYIKRSGVSGGKRKLSLKQTKKLIEDYPHTYLEFEVLYIYN